MGLAGQARAQEAPAPKPPAPQLSPDEEKAQALYVEGDRRYAEGRYEEAIELFKQALALSPAPLLHYNMANTYERMGAYAAAADSLAAYIDSGDARDADTLRQRLHQIRARAERRARFEADVAALRARPQACPEQTPCDVDTGPRSKNDTVAYVFFAGGGAMLVASVVFGAMASSAGNDARAGCTNSGAGTLCTEDAREAIDREKRFALFTDASVGVGLAALGAGTYFYLRHREAVKRAETRTTVAPALLRSGVGVTVGGRF